MVAGMFCFTAEDAREVDVPNGLFLYHPEDGDLHKKRGKTLGIS